MEEEEGIQEYCSRSLAPETRTTTLQYRDGFPLRFISDVPGVPGKIPSP